MLSKKRGKYTEKEVGIKKKKKKKKKKGTKKTEGEKRNQNI